MEDFKDATIKQRLANLERPPDCAAVRSSDVLAQVVQKDPVSADKKEFQFQQSNPSVLTCCTS